MKRSIKSRVCTRLVLATVAALALGLAGQAQATTITTTLTFDQFVDGHLFPGSAESVGSGFQFTSVFGDRIKASDIGAPHNTVLVDRAIDSNGSSEILSRLGGGLFSILSIDIADLSNNSAGGGGTGGLAGSGFRIGFSGNGQTQFSPTSSTFSTINVSANAVFQNISSLGINIVSGSSDNFAVDNIVVQFVPEPATLVLLGLGLAGVGFRSLRRKSRMAD